MKVSLKNTSVLIDYSQEFMGCMDNDKHVFPDVELEVVHLNFKNRSRSLLVAQIRNWKKTAIKVLIKTFHSRFPTISSTLMEHIYVNLIKISI